MSGVLAAMPGLMAGQSILDEQTVTSGARTVPTAEGSNYFYGYDTTVPMGSIADGTSDIYGGATIRKLYFWEEGFVTPPLGFTTREIVLEINGTLSNSGWEFIKIGGTTYSRTGAGFTTSGGVTIWVWGLAIPDPFTSGAPGPFSATTDVEFS